MFKLMHKKLNKKGFTLAELLVVIAILAILIAIAIPVFTGMVADAQLRVNQANVRSVRSAAVAKILTGMGGEDSYGNAMNSGTGSGKGWIATAQVDNNGDMSGLKIRAFGSSSVTALSKSWNGIALGKVDWNGSGYVAMGDDPQTDEPFASLKPSNGEGGVYTVRVYITDVDLE